jgi:hypothetical protein
MKAIKPEKKPDVTAALREAIIGGQLMTNERLIWLEDSIVENHGPGESPKAADPWQRRPGDDRGAGN